MSIMILIPGAWHTARCWERITPLLEERGHHVITPNLAGVGIEAHATDISLATWTDQVAMLVRRQSEPVVLVGHSRGGIVLSMVAEQVPDHVAYLVYVAGSLLPDGGTIASHGPTQDPSAANPLEMRDDGMATIRPEVARHAFLNKTDCEWTQRALFELVAEPIWVFDEPVHVTPSCFGSVPRAYIETLHDNGTPLEVQRRWQAELPCDPVFSLAADHSPFFSAPTELASALHAIAQRASSSPSGHDLEHDSSKQL